VQAVDCGDSVLPPTWAWDSIGSTEIFAEGTAYTTTKWDVHHAGPAVCLQVPTAQLRRRGGWVIGALPGAEVKHSSLPSVRGARSKRPCMPGQVHGRPRSLGALVYGVYRRGLLPSRCARPSFGVRHGTCAGVLGAEVSKLISPSSGFARQTRNTFKTHSLLSGKKSHNTPLGRLFIGTCCTTQKEGRVSREEI
jgi:hypothetical protein